MMAMNKEDLIEAYIDALIDGMDTKTLMQYVGESLYNEFNTYSEEQLKSEINEYYPHLLEEV